MNIYSLTRRSSASPTTLLTGDPPSSRLDVAGKITKSYCLSKGIGSNKLFGGDPPSSRLVVARKIPKSCCLSKGGVGSYTSSSFFSQTGLVSVTQSLFDIQSMAIIATIIFWQSLTAFHCQICRRLATNFQQHPYPHRCYRHFSVGQCHQQPPYDLRSTIPVEIHSSRWSFLPTIVVVAIVGAPPVAMAVLHHSCVWNHQAYLCMVVSARQASLQSGLATRVLTMFCRAVRVNLRSPISFQPVTIRFTCWTRSGYPPSAHCIC